MSSLDKSADKNWKEQVSSYFRQFTLTSSREQQLEHLLLTGKSRAVRLPFFSKDSLKFRLFTHTITALAAAVVAFAIIQYRDHAADAISEIAGIQGVRHYPADFDLEGDFSGFGELVTELLPRDSFNAPIPLEVIQEYQPAEGRFFTWGESPAVSIILKRPSSDQSRATLYMVKLTANTESGFPQEKTTKKVQTRSGKERHVKAWRDGRYGYAIVQTVATNED